MVMMVNIYDCHHGKFLRGKFGRGCGYHGYGNNDVLVIIIIMMMAQWWYNDDGNEEGGLMKTPCRNSGGP